MELALESYDVCIGLLQSKPKTPDGKHYAINLPNLRADAVISVEEVSGLVDKTNVFHWFKYWFQHVIRTNFSILPFQLFCGNTLSVIYAQ